MSNRSLSGYRLVTRCVRVPTSGPFEATGPLPVLPGRLYLRADTERPAYPRSPLASPLLPSVRVDPSVVVSDATQCPYPVVAAWSVGGDGERSVGDTGDGWPSHQLTRLFT